MKVEVGKGDDLGIDLLFYLIDQIAGQWGCLKAFASITKNLKTFVHDLCFSLREMMSVLEAPNYLGKIAPSLTKMLVGNMHNGNIRIR